ncbi:helix-turn-helix transcriptional regulator [Streptomyces sp. NPDC002004]
MTGPRTPRTRRPHSDQDLPATAWAVLGLLSFPGERTGYELKKWADASLRFFYGSPAISQIYAELRRLESLGYATSRRSGPEEPRTKRTYAITDAGRDALAGWAGGTQDVGPAVLKHPVLLRVWLGHLAAPRHLRDLVSEHIEHTREELAEVRGALVRADGVEAWAHPQIALRWSERRLLAELELSDAMLEDLDAVPPGAGPGPGAAPMAPPRSPGVMHADPPLNPGVTPTDPPRNPDAAPPDRPREAGAAPHARPPNEGTAPPEPFGELHAPPAGQPVQDAPTQG